jgi:hypothetical protein
MRVTRLRFCSEVTSDDVVLGGVMVIVLAIEPKGRGFDLFHHVMKCYHTQTHKSFHIIFTCTFIIYLLFTCQPAIVP